MEVFFSIITRKAIRRGGFTSVKQLTETIKRFIAAYNTDCEPFTWTKPAEVIISKAHGKSARHSSRMKLQLPDTRDERGSWGDPHR